MVLVARLELLIFLRAILGVFLLQNSLLIPIAYAHFLRSRYYYSSFTRDAVNTVIALADGFANKPDSPPAVKTVWGHTKTFVGRWAGAQIQPAPPAAAGPGAGRR